MFDTLDARPHAFRTRLHAVRGPLPRPLNDKRFAVIDRVRTRFAGSIDKDTSLLLEEWRSDEPGAQRGIFESRVRVRKACALVSAATLEYDDGERVSFAPWDDDVLECLFVPLPYRTTGVLELRCEATPFRDTAHAFRLRLRCDKWTHEVTVPAK
jgi:hypothetical protein